LRYLGRNLIKSPILKSFCQFFQFFHFLSEI